MTKPTIGDHLKAQGIRWMRRSHLRTLETTSDRTYRRRKMPTSPAPRLVPAARAHRGMGWLPTSLLVPERLPREAKLPNKYYLPYYATSKIGWTLYGSNPINPAATWSPDLSWNDFFPGPDEGWGSPTTDDTFVALRLQGPNPFMLRQVDALDDLGESAGDTVYSLDFRGLFAHIFPGVEARFTLTGTDLTASSILIEHPVGKGEELTIDLEVVRPSDGPRWDDAKRIVNGLDARYAVFIRHLLNVHLMVGQAYALAAYSLPTWHPLRPFMHFFTYGTLVVNDAAYKALLVPNSYFLRSNFVSADDTRHMVQNAMEVFDFDEWIWPRDRAKRKLDEIPNHPYVAHADVLWDAFETMVNEHLDAISVGDDPETCAVVVGEDRDIARWFETLTDVLPGDERLQRLTTRAELVELMTALLWNNVVHEVCGNLSPILNVKPPHGEGGAPIDPDDLVSVNFEQLRKVAARDESPDSPAAGDVFLMAQATYVSRFNVSGNGLVEIPAARYIDDPRLHRSVTKLQQQLRDLEDKFGDRRRGDIAFQQMRPSKFEVSISF